MHSEISKPGRPRSEEARKAVLNAVDDLLGEQGYAAMTMKGIAESAGVGRQTVYRWWSTKAEILFEAVRYDAPQELAVRPRGSLEKDVGAFVDALQTFLTDSDAGAAYRALLGEAQHDPAVAALIASEDVVSNAARAVLTAAVPGARSQVINRAVLVLVGPVVFAALTGRLGSSSKQLRTTLVASVVALLT